MPIVYSYLENLCSVTKYHSVKCNLFNIPPSENIINKLAMLALFTANYLLHPTGNVGQGTTV